jgi:thioredoxin 1
MSLPTLILFVAGEPVATFVGAQPKARLLARIDDALR